MSSKLSAWAITAQTAITRMSSSRCSTFHAQRGSSINANSAIRASSMAFLRRERPTALAGQPAGIEAPDLMRLPWLQALAWRGNVRELENCIHRAIVLARGPMIEPEDIRPGPGARPPEAARPVESAPLPLVG